MTWVLITGDTAPQVVARAPQGIADRTVRRIALMAIATIGLASASPALAKKGPEPIEYGPIPTWDRFREMAEQAVRMRLVDPDSATIQWPWGFTQGWWKPMLAKRVSGYYTCGMVNARNRMGGYNGNSFFIVFIDYGAVRYLDMDQVGHSIIAGTCARAPLPPVTMMEKLTYDKTKLGVMFTVVPDGLRLDGVFAESAADRAGLKAGMVMTQVNDTALKGLNHDAAAPVISSMPSGSQVTLADGTVLTVTRP